MSRIKDRHRVGLYFTLAFAISWAFWLPAAGLNISIQTPLGKLLEVAGNFGPFAAALVVIRIYQGRSGLRALLDRLFTWRVPARWYLFALLGPFALMAAAIAASTTLGGPALQLRSPGSLLVIIPTFLRTLFIAGGLNEETGWRGAALPGLLAQTSATRASILLGVLWGLWHAPLYFLPGTGQSDMIRGGGDFLFLFSAFIVWTIGLSFLFTWLHEMTQGSLLVLILFHAAINTAAGLPFLLGVQASLAPLLYPAFTWVAVLVVTRGKPFIRHLSNSHVDPRVSS